MALMTVIIWGLQFPVAKSTFETVNAYHAALFRFGVAAIILTVLLLALEGWRALKPDAEAVKLALLGLLGMFLTPTLIFGGLMFTQPEIAAVVVATQPILSVLVQRIWQKERTDILSLLCVIVAFTGVITVVTRWDTTLSLSKKEIIGDLMVLLGAFCWVVYTIACARYKHWSNLRLTAWTLCSGSIGHLVLVWVLVAVGWYAHPSFSEWYQVRYELLFLAIIGVVIAMYSWNAGARLLGAINAMLFINLIPVVTFMYRYFQGYRYSLIEIFGVALVIGALLLQNYALRRRMAKTSI